MKTTTPTSLRTGRRMDLQVRFYLQEDASPGVHEVYCQIILNGQQAHPYGTGVYLPFHLWNPITQLATGASLEAQTVNSSLSDIRAEHRNILRLLLRSQLQPTAEEIRRIWLTGDEVMLTLLQAYDEYLLFLNQQPLSERKTEPTLYKWHKGYRYLKEYLTDINRLDLVLTEVTPGWAHGYVRWLHHKFKTVDTAARNFYYVRAAVDHAVDTDQLTFNPLWEVQIKYPPDKNIVYLTQEQLRLLREHPLTPKLNVFRCWALLCCYTGLDYKDAIEVVHQQPECIRNTPYGRQIVWQRNKIKAQLNTAPQDGVCFIPILEETKHLLEEAVAWPIPSIYRMNANLKQIQRLIDLPFRLTTKTCRRTAGVVFLMKGYRIEAVQRILGHKNFATMMRHYIRFMGDLVTENMRTVQGRVLP